MATTRKPFAFTREQMLRLKKLFDKDGDLVAVLWHARHDDGLVEIRWSSAKGGRAVGVYDGRIGVGGVEDDGEHDLPWYTLCLLPGDEHGGLVHHQTRKLAQDWASHPGDAYCDGCRDGVPWKGRP
jgi:hypothetical protein